MAEFILRHGRSRSCKRRFDRVGGCRRTSGAETAVKGPIGRAEYRRWAVRKSYGYKAVHSLIKPGAPAPTTAATYQDGPLLLPPPMAKETKKFQMAHSSISNLVSEKKIL
ncbi:ORF2 [Giant panda anellovirus]|uniref:ORF2 n=1 Tax=Giant panda anellovirus TaxID=2016460 RepID=A0A220IGK9_9VIRU|nr:ORF2 [Giant panda anellovirus]ASH99119.1 ORF2 [Giant panda anellovirus]